MSTTRTMNLRTGRPVWSRERRPAIEQDRNSGSQTDADVLIIGAGISGALAADLLSEAGLDVVIVDRRGAIKGASAAPRSCSTKSTCH